MTRHRFRHDPIKAAETCHEWSATLQILGLKMSAEELAYRLEYISDLTNYEGNAGKY